MAAGVISLWSVQLVIDIGRLEFISIVAGATLAWPITARETLVQREHMFGLAFAMPAT
jgi:hypothetical protein